MPVRINRYNGGIGRLTRVSASSGIQFSSDNGKNKEEKNDRLNGHYDEYMDFDVPWSISLDYTFSYSKNYSRNTAPGAKKPLSSNTISQMVRINGDFSLTPKWKIGYSTGYDFQQKEVTATSFNLTRDLHCWEMTFSCIPFGTHQSYNFQINVRSSLLKDLKLTKRGLLVRQEVSTPAQQSAGQQPQVAPIFFCLCPKNSPYRTILI